MLNFYFYSIFQCKWCYGQQISLTSIFLFYVFMTGLDNNVSVVWFEAVYCFGGRRVNFFCYCDRAVNCLNILTSFLELEESFVVQYPSHWAFGMSLCVVV
jgi:hypothetical protein